MGRYFGTDGIRGKANKSLNVETAFLIGRFLGFNYDTKKNGPIIIGKDTRLSGDMFESALASGAVSSGADVVLLGVCPTPSIIYFVTHDKFSCGVMISASHNPYYDNGIKVISDDGTKLAGPVEERLEDYMDHKFEIPYAESEKIGRIISKPELLEDYLNHLVTSFNMDLSNYHILLDLTNGSSTKSAIKVLSRLNAKITYLNNEPNGININYNCGSTHPEMMVDEIKKDHYDLGLAFDGDADRLIACDENGNIIDGDMVLYIIGKYLDDHGLLKDHVIVTTIMSNIGLYKALDEVNIKYEKTAVGDKNVYECMMKNDYKIGGEQSGHTIIKDYSSTGDGLQTGLMLLKIMKETGKKISELASPVKIYPQVLVNVNVNNKKEVLDNLDLRNKISEIENKLGDDGRILVRASGTESLIRVMAEAKSLETCQKYVDEVVNIIKAKGL